MASKPFPEHPCLLSLSTKTSDTSLDQVTWSASFFCFRLIFICWLVDKLDWIALQSIINVRPPSSIVSLYVSFGHCVLNPQFPSAWDSLMDEGWQSLIMLSGTDYHPTCFLLAHIHVTLLMNYSSTQKGSLSWGSLSVCLHAMLLAVHWAMTAHPSQW